MLEFEDDRETEDGGITRRRMVGYMLAGPTLITGATLLKSAPAGAAGIPTVQVVDAYDLSDALRDSHRPTHFNVALKVNEDGTVEYALNRSENGQGITTVFGMVIAEELDVPLEKVKVTLRDADPSLLFNQLTGGSNSVYSLYLPVRTAAALAKAGLMGAASRRLGVPEHALTARDGIISGGGQSVGYGELATSAAVSDLTRKSVTLKPRSQFRIIGTPTLRTDALAAVTGKKQFAMDLKIPGALPTMICRAPTHNGEAEKLVNEAEILAMPGVTDVGIIKRELQYPGGVAVRAQTFGQCIDAIRKMQVEWAADGGPVKGQDSKSVAKKIREGLLPMAPALPGTIQEADFVFNFRPGDPLEPNCAVADIREGSGTIWAASKNPIWGMEEAARLTGLSRENIVFHVVEGGGSFGRKLFNDPAFEAALASKMFGKPVRLMWHRADMPRQGRSKPAAICRTRMVHTATEVLSAEQAHAGVPNDLSHGLGEAATSDTSSSPGGVYGFSQTVFTLTAVTPYNFGIATHLLNEVFQIADFNTSSVRNVYSPELRTAQELIVDKTAEAMGKDPFDFRQEFARDERMRDVLAKLREVSQWGRPLPEGVAQGVAIHREYKAFIGFVMEIDTRAKMVNRKVPRGVAGPRVIRATCVVDPGTALNPSGYKAMMMGGAMDGIAQCLTYGLHLNDGRFLEGSWDHAHYTRQWNSPLKLNIEILNSGKGEPGGAGELGVAPSMAATACALARATGTMPTEFPVNFGTLGFKPFPAIPPIPKSPTNGFARARRERNRARRHT
jgi:isoquinoline 1-oxidoreductase beta subunit